MIVMLRDASYWSKPGFASKYHCVAVGKVGPLGHSVALCSKRIQLDEASAINKSRVDEALICKRCATMNSS